ncbi:MAG TPA: DEAD/DEAH box helicase family protein [Coleofasciculaceae cyanobacterium]|jgi:hypothetical protein
MFSRAKDLNAKEYAKMLRKPSCCQHCGSSGAILTLDHAVPRDKVGDRIPAFFSQWLCEDCNRKKSCQADPYWIQPTPFDPVFDQDNNLVWPDLSRLLNAQKDVFERIWENQEIFTNPEILFHALNKDFLVCQQAGSGKTYEMAFILPAAINHVLKSFDEACPRIDKILIITIDQDLRRQTTRELQTEAIALGLIPSNKFEVVELTDRKDAQRLVRSNPRHSMAGRIYVCCQQLIWESGEESIDSLIMDFLGLFNYIAADESHWAEMQQRKIRSFVSGFYVKFSASPFDAVGEAHRNQLLISQYSYEDIQSGNGASKIIPKNNPFSICKPIDYSGFSYYQGESIKQGNNAPSDAAQQFEIIKGLVEAGFHQILYYDAYCAKVIGDWRQVREESLSKEEFRNRHLHTERYNYTLSKDALPCLVYPVHAVIRFSKFEDLIYAYEHAQKLVNENPEYENFRPSKAHARNKYLGKTYSSEPLNEKHP